MTASPGLKAGGGDGIGAVCGSEVAAVPLLSSASSGMRNEYVRPTGENLTLTNGRCGPALMSASMSGGREPPRSDDRSYRLDLKCKPVSNNLRTRIPLERGQRTIYRRKRAKHAVWIERFLQPIEQRPQISVRQAAVIRAGKKGTQIANYR